MQLIRVAFVCGSLMVASVCWPVKGQPSKSAAPESQKSASSTGANDPDAVALLQRMEQTHGQIRSVAGEFTQQRIDASFGADKIESTARFSLLKPNYFRVDYLTPKQSTNLITGQNSFYYVPDQKQVQKYTFKNRTSVRDLNYLLLGFGAPTEELLSVYTAQRGDAKNSVKLIPRNSKEAQFKYIVMEVNDSLMPKRFSMEQNDGGKLVVNIDTAGLQVGAPLSAGDFKPNWPSGTSEVDME